jgi:NTE family protein
MTATRVALSLGSGGARGYAHIGVIKELHRRGYDIVGIAGSSMGALVGGLEAAHKLDDFTDWAKSLTQRTMLRLLDPSITSAGVLRAEKILDEVHDIVGETRIERLRIPYTAVATDLIAGESVWLQDGPVDTAIRASIAIPGVITPHVLDGRLLADGGILDPLPMAPIAEIDADLTIAVNLNGRDADGGGDDGELSPTAEWLNRMLRSSSTLLDTDTARSLLDSPTARTVLGLFGTPIPESGAWPASNESDESDESDEQPIDAGDEAPPAPRLGVFEVMNRTIEISQGALAGHQLANFPPDVLIEVPRTACRSLEFHRATELINIGHVLTARALDSLDRDVPTIDG